MGEKGIATACPEAWVKDLQEKESDGKGNSRYKGY
jgi:hypothetical protein